MNVNLLNWIEANVDQYPANATAELYAAAKRAFPSLNKPEMALYLREAGRRALQHAEALRAEGAPANQN